MRAALGAIRATREAVGRRLLMLARSMIRPVMTSVMTSRAAPSRLQSAGSFFRRRPSVRLSTLRAERRSFTLRGSSAPWTFAPLPPATRGNHNRRHLSAYRSASDSNRNLILNTNRVN